MTTDLQRIIMAITKNEKEHLISTYRIHEQDSGSTDVQVALLTENIKVLTEHCREHPKDNSSRRGLLIMVSKRRKLLKYLQKNNMQGYLDLIKNLGLKK